MNGKYALDTNIVIALIASDPSVLANISSAKEIFTPSIVLGELYFGANKSTKVTDNIKTIDNYAASSNILNCDKETAAQYGIIKHKLQKKGRPLPENDMWIAAVTVQHNLTLVTRDSHFNEVDGLIIVKW